VAIIAKKIFFIVSSFLSVISVVFNKKSYFDKMKKNMHNQLSLIML
jgi:hypothetical protein